jgi:3-phosphoglycerate kinase
MLTDWFINNFINDLKEGSVIMTDNTRYHSITLNKFLSTSSKKTEITDWPKKRGEGEITVKPT